MTETADTPPVAKPDPTLNPGSTPEQIAKSARTHRLAAALRDNLRRRKAAKPVVKRPGN